MTTRIDNPDVQFDSSDGYHFSGHSALFNVRWAFFKSNSSSAIPAIASLDHEKVISVLEFLYAGLVPGESSKTSFAVVKIPFPLPRAVSTLPQDMKTLLTSGNGSDFVIESCGKRFKVHRFMLAIRCGFFASLFQSRMQEAEAGVLSDRIAHAADQMQAFLDYVYTGDASFKTIEDGFKLMEMCGFYLVHECVPGDLDEFVGSKFIAGFSTQLPEIISRAKLLNFPTLGELMQACEI
jgi:hypothetical protein